MGRPSMSPEAITNNRISIISAAMEMIREGGIQSVTARSLGCRVGMNSALIYRYFSDIDEVVLFACVHALQEYNRDMSAAFAEANMTLDDTYDEDIYVLSWELFSKHAFNNPEEYMTLFFSKHSAHLRDVIAQYYELFPDVIGSRKDAIIEGMLRTADLRKRNLLVLIPVLEGRKSEQDIILLNDITVSFCFSLLTQLASHDESVTSESQKKRMLECVHYTLK